MTELVERQHFVALTPAELPAAQQGIADWCRQTIAALGRELREQRQNLAQAKAAKWKHSGWQNMVSRTKARMIYYSKIQAAVRAGYLIVPNFETEVLAVRVKHDAPPIAEEDSTRSYKGDYGEISAERLPPGEGHYVSDKAETTVQKYQNPKPNNQSETRYLRKQVGYAAPNFPVVAVKPMVLDATQRAMALNVFDRIGVVTGRKQDPVVIGEIIHPDARLGWSRSSQKRVSFFIAWWLDTNSL